MYDDARLAAAFRSMVAGTAAPVPPLAAIGRRLAAVAPPSRGGPVLRLGIAAALLIVLVLVAIRGNTSAFVQTVGSRIAAVLQWTPPPLPPASLSVSIVPRTADIADAQRRVSFRIVPPAGLPADITRVRMWTAPVLVYSKVTHSWSKGEPEITFAYERAGGRSFELIADRYDPRFGPPPRFMFEDDSSGRRYLVKHRNFAWRNGDQAMGATEGAGISAAEIETIRGAMRAVAIPTARTAADLQSGTLVKQILLKAP